MDSKATPVWECHYFKSHNEFPSQCFSGKGFNQQSIPWEGLSGIASSSICQYEVKIRIIQIIKCWNKSKITREMRNAKAKLQSMSWTASSSFLQTGNVNIWCFDSLSKVCKKWGCNTRGWETPAAPSLRHPATRRRWNDSSQQRQLPEDEMRWERGTVSCYISRRNTQSQDELEPLEAGGFADQGWRRTLLRPTGVRAPHCLSSACN